MKWTTEQLKIVQNGYFDVDKEILIAKINKSWDAIKLKAHQRGLKRSKGLRCYGNLKKLLEETNCAYYWLGMILADGCFHNHRLVLKVQKSDSYHIDELRRFLEYEGPSWGTNNLAIMNKELVPQIMAKFGTIQRKTFNPPNLPYINDDLLTSLIIGYIDGDGNITKQNKSRSKLRRDCFIRIKCHANWLDTLNYFSDRLSAVVKIKPNYASINKEGYANINWSNSELIRYLKLESKKVPAMSRKWNKIDEDFISTRSIFKMKKQKIIELYKNGMKKSQIAREVKVSNSTVTMTTKEIGVGGEHV